MAAMVEEAETALSDEIMDLKKQVRDMNHSQADDHRHIRQLQTEMKGLATKVKEMEDLAAMNARLQDARINNIADTLASLCERETAGGSGNPAANVLAAHRRLDAIIQQLAAQVERSGSLQVHETKVACHCTHTMLNTSIKKLGKRMGQIERGMAKMKRLLGGGRAAREGQKNDEADEGLDDDEV